MNYNISLNCNTDEEGGEIKKTKDVSQNTTVAYLNWDEIDSEEVQVRVAYITQLINSILCSFPQHEADVQPFVQPIEPADVIIGSELTYSPLSVYTLTKVIQKYLKPDGVFYEVLSDDRDVRTSLPLFSLALQSLNSPPHPPLPSLSSHPSLSINIKGSTFVSRCNTGSRIRSTEGSGAGKHDGELPD